MFHRILIKIFVRVALIAGLLFVFFNYGRGGNSLINADNPTIAFFLFANMVAPAFALLVGISLIRLIIGVISGTVQLDLLGEDLTQLQNLKDALMKEQVLPF